VAFFDGRKILTALNSKRRLAGLYTRIPNSLHLQSPISSESVMFHADRFLV